MGLAINWQQQSNKYMDQFNLHNIHLCDSHSPNNAFAATFVEWNQSRNLCEENGE